MNNVSFYVKVCKLKLDTSCKNCFVGMDESFLFFSCYFDGLDEITPYHDYLDTIYKIYH
jgi:hypothetical protein